MSLTFTRNELDFNTRQELRKLKVCPAIIKNIVYTGCKNPQGTIQFGSDLQVYNVWEALLYVQGYEPTCFEVGTAQMAVNAYEADKIFKAARKFRAQLAKQNKEA